MLCTAAVSVARATVQVPLPAVSSVQPDDGAWVRPLWPCFYSDTSVSIVRFWYSSSDLDSAQDDWIAPPDPERVGAWEQQLRTQALRALRLVFAHVANAPLSSVQHAQSLFHLAIALDRRSLALQLLSHPLVESLLGNATPLLVAAAYDRPVLLRALLSAQRRVVGMLGGEDGAGGAAGIEIRAMSPLPAMPLRFDYLLTALNTAVAAGATQALQVGKCRTSR